MKKLVIGFAVLFFAFNVVAQDSMPKREISTWLGGGANYSTMHFEKDRLMSDVSPRLGFNVGSTFRIHFLRTPFEFDFGVLYSRKGSVAEEKQVALEDFTGLFDYKIKYTINYLDFPILFNIASKSSNKYQFYCGTGLLISWGLKGKITETWTSEPTDVEKTSEIIFGDKPEAHLHNGDISYKVQLGLRSSKKYDINASYSKSLFNIDPNAESIKNSNYSLSVFFFLGSSFSGR